MTISNADTAITDDILFGLPPIAGGDGEGEGDSTAGDAAGGDTPGEGQDGQGDGQGKGDQGGPAGQGDAPQDDGRGQAKSPHVPYERFQEVNERLRQTEATLHTLLRRQNAPGEGDGRNGRRQYKPDDDHAEYHKVLGPYVGSYVGHHLEPLAAIVMQLHGQQADQADATRFYRNSENAALPPKALEAIEKTVEELRPKISQITRIDVLNWLRGSREHADLFVTKPKPQPRLAEATVAANRSAGNTPRPAAGGRGGGKPTDLSTIDRSKLKPGELSKMIEEQMAGAKF